ncbi:hypothetical protein D3C78_1003790 [compost metagenome]
MLAIPRRSLTSFSMPATVSSAKLRALRSASSSCARASTISSMPRRACSGTLNSWLALTRKSSFCWLPSSACSLALRTDCSWSWRSVMSALQQIMPSRWPLASRYGAPQWCSTRRRPWMCTAISRANGWPAATACRKKPCSVAASAAEYQSTSRVRVPSTDSRSTSYMRRKAGLAYSRRPPVSRT